MRVLFEAVEDGRGGRHTGGEGKARNAAFEIGDATFKSHARRILRARIFKALVDTGAGLRIGRCRVDRCNYRSGRWIIVLSGMHAARGEAECVALCHHFISFARCENN
jgi:hypothetical protein